MKFLFHDGDKQVGADCDPDLRFDRVRGRAVECLDPQMLLDPFEEEFDLPAGFVELGNRGGVEVEVVGQENERFLRLGIAVTDSSKRLRVFSRRIVTREQNRLVADETRRPVDMTRVATAEVEVLFRPCHEERSGRVEIEEPPEIEISSVDKIERPRHRNEDVHDIDFVSKRIGNMNEFGDIPPQVEQHVQLDRRLGGTEVRPWKKRQAQIDRRGIEGVNRRVQVDSKILVGIERLGFLNENLGDVGVDAPVPGFVGVGQCAARHRRADPHMEQLRMKTPQAGLDVAEAFPIGQLSEQHAKQMIPAGKRTNMLVSRISRDAGAKTTIRKKVHDLRENETTRVHAPSWLTEGSMLSANNRRISGYNIINLN